MSMLKEICQHIEDRTGFTKASGRLQVGHMTQSAPDRCNVISDPAGGEPNFYCPDMANVNIQVLSRGLSYFNARDDAYAIYWALHGESGWNIPRIDGSGEDYLAMTIEAISLPGYIGQDENRRYVFSTNYIFRMEEGSCTP